jgi:hypothetical protein
MVCIFTETAGGLYLDYFPYTEKEYMASCIPIRLACHNIAIYSKRTEELYRNY